jgi:hypothetical protein
MRIMSKLSDETRASALLLSVEASIIELSNNPINTYSGGAETPRSAASAKRGR